MASFNQITLLGNATRDPQFRYLPNQTPVCDFGMACNRKFKTQGGEDREEVLFIDCTAFGRQAEIVNEYVTKGKQLLISGRLKYETWDDKNGGGKRSKHGIIVETMQLLGDPRANESEQQDEQPPQKAMTPRERSVATRPASLPVSGKKMFAEADIPF
jgi:single-strand DNA-binding protein